MHPLLKRINDRIREAATGDLTAKELNYEISSIQNEIDFLASEEGVLNTDFTDALNILKSYVVMPMPNPTFVLTNADKLNQSNISFGTISTVTGEGNRVEQLVGDDPTDEEQWAILQDTAHVTIRNNWGNGLSVFAISCPSGTDTQIGWRKLSDGLLLNTGGQNIYYFEIKYNDETMTVSSGANLTNGLFIVPDCAPKRCADLIVNFVD